MSHCEKKQNLEYKFCRQEKPQTNHGIKGVHTRKNNNNNNKVTDITGGSHRDFMTDYKESCSFDTIQNPFF